MDRRTQDELMRRLRVDADRICDRFGLRYRSLDPERANVKRRYGICYDDGSIKIRLRHASTGEPLKYSSLVNTLCHELAHLKHFNHGPQFKLFYARLLEWARQEGIYRPGPCPCPPALPATPRVETAWLFKAHVSAREVGPTRPPMRARRPARTPGGPGGAAPEQLDLFC